AERFLPALAPDLRGAGRAADHQLPVNRAAAWCSTRDREPTLRAGRPSSRRANLCGTQSAMLQHSTDDGSSRPDMEARFETHRCKVLSSQQPQVTAIADCGLIADCGPTSDCGPNQNHW